MKFRKKPVEIDAVQWDGTPSFKFTQDLIPYSDKCLIELEYTSGQLFIRTLEGRMEVSPNDWIIKGVSGELYPCKPDIFEKTYESCA